MKTLKIALLSMIVLSVVSCSATPTRRSFNETWKDSVIVSKVKWDIGRDSKLQDTSVDISTWRGTVTLVGRVGTAEEKARVEEVARQVKDVKDVKNYLDVVGSEKTENVATKEKAVKTDKIPAVEKKEEKLVKKEPVTPQNIIVNKDINEEDLMEEVQPVKETVAKKGKEKAGVKSKKKDWVEYEIDKDLALSGEESEGYDDITSQAEQELKELKIRKGKYSR